MYWWIILDSRDNFDWDDPRHSVDQVAIFWAKDEREAKNIAKKWGFHEFDMAGKFKTLKAALKDWKGNQRDNPPHKYDEIAFAVKDGKMIKGIEMNRLDESFKAHYPSLKKITQMHYTDPRLSKDLKNNIKLEKEGKFKHGDKVYEGSYIVYEDDGFCVGVHVANELNEDDGQPIVNVVAMDRSSNYKNVRERVGYRMRRSKNLGEDAPFDLMKQSDPKLKTGDEDLEDDETLEEVSSLVDLVRGTLNEGYIDKLGKLEKKIGKDVRLAYSKDGKKVALNIGGIPVTPKIRLTDLERHIDYYLKNPDKIKQENER